MLTISAKELRLRLSEMLQRAESGEEIEVIYRSRPAVRLVPLQAGNQPNGAIIARTLGNIGSLRTPASTDPDPNKTYDELYGDIIEERYGA